MTETLPPFQLSLPPAKSDPARAAFVASHGSVVIVGANGSGKTRLGSWIESNYNNQVVTHRISAQKSLAMPEFVSTSSIDSAEYDLLYGYYDVNQVRGNPIAWRTSHRWGNKPIEFLLNDFEKLMKYLFSEEFEVSTKYRQASFDAKTLQVAPKTKLDVVKQIWQLLLPHRELVIGGGKVETRVRGEVSLSYNASQMSDGERVTFYLIGQCLAAPQNGVIIIDEPELHLHKAVQTRLWDAVEAERPDCLFVYLTHDLDFAASRTTATKVWLKSFDGQNWDWYEVQKQDDLPEELLLEVLGSRKPVLFVEGDRGSLDYFFFSHLYPNFTVIPCGGCEQVIHTTASFNALKHIHSLKCYGIVDRDLRSDEDVTNLERANVFVLGVAEIENLLLHEAVLQRIAAELHLDTSTSRMATIKAKVLDQLRQEKGKVASALTMSKIERILRQPDTKTQGADNIQQALDSLVARIQVRQTYADAVSEIDNMLSTQDYEQAIQLYSNKGLLPQISQQFGIHPQSFKDMIKRLLSDKKGENVLVEMRKHVPDMTARLQH